MKKKKTEKGVYGTISIEGMGTWTCGPFKRPVKLTPLGKKLIDKWWEEITKPVKRAKKK